MKEGDEDEGVLEPIVEDTYDTKIKRVKYNEIIKNDF